MKFYLSKLNSSLVTTRLLFQRRLITNGTEVASNALASGSESANASNKKLKYNKIGFIGTGNMAQAIIQGLINQKKFTPEQIYASDNDWEYIEFLQKNSPLFMVRF